MQVGGVVRGLEVVREGHALLADRGELFAALGDQLVGVGGLQLRGGGRRRAFCHGELGREKPAILPASFQMPCRAYHPATSSARAVPGLHVHIFHLQRRDLQLHRSAGCRWPGPRDPGHRGPTRAAAAGHVLAAGGHRSGLRGAVFRFRPGRGAPGVASQGGRLQLARWCTHTGALGRTGRGPRLRLEQLAAGARQRLSLPRATGLGRATAAAGADGFGPLPRARAHGAHQCARRVAAHPDAAGARPALGFGRLADAVASHAGLAGLSGGNRHRCAQSSRRVSMGLLRRAGRHGADKRASARSLA